MPLQFAHQAAAGVAAKPVVPAAGVRSSSPISEEEESRREGEEMEVDS